MRVQNSEKYLGTLCFSGQAHAKWPITPECKKYIPYSEKFMGNSVFQGKGKLLKTPECITYMQYSEKFQGSSVFQGKRMLLKTPE